MLELQLSVANCTFKLNSFHLIFLIAKEVSYSLCLCYLKPAAKEYAAQYHCYLMCTSSEMAVVSRL